MNIQELHNRLIKRANENSKTSLVGDVVVPLAGAYAGMEGSKRLGIYDKIDEAVNNKEMQRITERGKALKEKLPNLNLDRYTQRATRHLDKVRSQQGLLKQVLSGSNKYNIPLLLAMTLGGGVGAKSLYNRYVG